MTTLIKAALAATITYALVKIILKNAGTDSPSEQSGVDAANPPSSVDDIPTLQAEDTDPRSSAPLREGDGADVPNPAF